MSKESFEQDKHKAINHLENALNELILAMKELYRPDEKDAANACTRAMKSVTSAKNKILENEKNKNIEGQLSLEDILDDEAERC